MDAVFPAFMPVRAYHEIKKLHNENYYLEVSKYTSFFQYIYIEI